MSFTNIYNELLDLAQKHANAGEPLQSIYGAMEAAQSRVGFLLTEQYKNKQVLEDWDKAKAKCGVDLETGQLAIGDNAEAPLVDAEPEN